MAKKVTLKSIVICCETRFNRGPAVEWKHSDFNDLSREILRATEVNISPNTLKRIFGKISVDDDYLPQQATIEALKKYGGYIPPENGVTEREPEPVKSVSQDTLKRYIVPIIIAAVVVIFCGLLVMKVLKQEPDLYGNIALTGTEGTLPATAFFDLKLPQTKDSIFVEFGDKSPLSYVTPGEQKTAHNYLFPGVFKAGLYVGKNKVSTTNVYIRSNKWVGLGYRRQRDLSEHYYQFPAVKTGPDSLFHIHNSQLHKMGLDTAGPIYTRLCNFTPLSHIADNFIFEASFKNLLHEKGLYCNSTQFQIAGENSFIRFKLVSPGCSYGVLNVISEQVFEGRKNNLSQFVIDLEKWNAVKLINKDKHVSLFVNGKLVFDGTYQRPLGEIRGLFLEFEGNGFVRACDLKSSDGKMLYHF